MKIVRPFERSPVLLLPYQPLFTCASTHTYTLLHPWGKSCSERAMPRSLGGAGLGFLLC